MANGKKITITFVNSDRVETTRDVKEGDRISSLVPSNQTAILNGLESHRDAELRANDRVEAIPKSVKAGL